MKNQLFFAIILVLIFAFPSFSLELTAGYDNEEPYHYLDENGNVIGTDADILTEILKRSGHTIVFKRRPWTRTLIGVESGELDIAIGAKYTDERANFAYYSAPYKTIKHWLYTRDEEYEKVTSLELLLANSNRKLGVVRGWGYPPEIARIINDEAYKNNIVAVDSFIQLPKMLAGNRLDGIIATPETLKIAMKEARIKKKFSVRAQYEEQLHFLFSKKSVNPEIVTQCNADLFKLHTEGMVREIFRKYLK